MEKAKISFSLAEHLIGKKKILSDLSCSFFQGSVVAIVGPNGAGKTTLLNALLTPKNIKNLSFKFGPSDLKSLSSRDYVSLISFLGSSDFFKPRLTLKEFFKSSCYYFSFSELGFYEALEQWGLDGLEGVDVSTLSLGQFQRVLLAISCFQGSKLYIFDEPERHLDPSGIKTLTEVIRQKKQGNKTILFATHDLNLALSSADFFIGINSLGRQEFFHEKAVMLKLKSLDELFLTSFNYYQASNGLAQVFL